MKKLYWDIETSSIEDTKLLEKLIPEFEAPGNIKDPLKITAALAEKRADWLDKNALRGITGQIIALTLAEDNLEPEFVTGDEKKLIERIFSELADPAVDAYAWYGSGFDLPFVCQRAAVHNIQAYPILTVKAKGRYYFRENLIDPKLVWANYNPDHRDTSLAKVALALGVGEKSGNGKDFAALLKTDRDKAIEYAKNDVILLRGIVQRMGI